MTRQDVAIVVQVVGMVYIVVVVAFCCVRILPGLLGLGRLWTLFERKICRSVELTKDAVRYDLEGMPKNASACMRSAEENMKEAGEILGTHQRRHW